MDFFEDLFSPLVPVLGADIVDLLIGLLILILGYIVAKLAERIVVALGHEDSINPDSRHYLNRLSDLLFVVARVLARRNGGEEVLWEQHSSSI